MATRMLIDARHPEETRVAVLKGNRIEEFDFESADHKQIKGNIYLAKVTRVEPSLQAAFVDFGGNRHGFLAFSEIHPDYYQIRSPTARRCSPRSAPTPRKRPRYALPRTPESDGDYGDESELSDAWRSTPARTTTSPRSKTAWSRTARRAGAYKIQEVIKRRQILLVQVVKEERGNKGAALTTYLSLAGRYCVLMPNTARGGGISRKITDMADRKRLKEIVPSSRCPKAWA
jgi:ribonuclease E